MKIKKKGVSSIIAEVLLILLTASAIGIIIVFVVPFVMNSLYGSTQCSGYENYFVFQESFRTGGEDLNYNCYDESGLVGISISAIGDGDEKVSGMMIKLSGEEDSEQIQLVKEKDSSCNLNGVKMLGFGCEDKIDIPDSGETKTYVYNGQGRIFDKVEVYPLLADGDLGKICVKTDEIKLIKCNGVDLTE